jgi:hypothetical protein
VIEKLKQKNLSDLIEFFDRVNDKYQDTYITLNKERIFLKGNWSLIEKILKYQEIYAVIDKEIKGIMIILHEKGFRPYVKLLAENTKFTIDLLKFLKWNFLGQNLFFKLKKENPLSQMILKTGFIKIGDRGAELLFEKKAIKEIYKFTPKDDYLPKEENRLY